MLGPLYIHHVSDITNTQVWTMYDPFRKCFIIADGYMIMWGFLDLNDLLTASYYLVFETQGRASLP